METIISGSGESYDSLQAIADLRAKKKAIKKQKREERKAFRKGKKELFKTFAPEKQDYLKNKFEKKKESLKRAKEIKRDTHNTILNLADKKRVSFESLKELYTPYSNVVLLLELFVKKLVSFEEGAKVQISPKWIEFLKLAKVIETPNHRLYQYSYRRRRKYHKEDSPIARVSIPLFFALDKLYKDFVLKRSLKRVSLIKAESCIKLITKLIKKSLRFSPRLQKFLDLLGIEPSFNIEIHNVLPIRNVSVFPEQAAFDGKLNDDCPICYIKDSEPAIRLKCKHVFHKSCIVEWFNKDKTCAICREKC